MAQAVSYDDPVDLSRGKLMNGLIKEEQRSLERHAVYGGHNGIRVGIPDQNHGMLMRLNKKISVFLVRPTLKIFLFPLIRPCFTSMGQ